MRNRSILSLPCPVGQLLGVWLLVAFDWQSSAANFEIQSWPVPISIEGQRVASSMYLRLEVKRYDLPLTDFATGALDERERAFVDVAGGIQEKDTRRVAKSLGSVKEDGILVSESSAGGIMDLYRQAFGEFKNVKVIAQVLTGSRSLFIWEVPQPDGLRRRAFAVERDATGKWLTTEVTSSSPVEALIVDVFHHAGRYPATSRPKADSQKQHRYELPVGRGKRKEGMHPVYLEFNGQFTDFDIFNPQLSPTSEVLRYYSVAWGKFKDRALDAFVDEYTPGSRAKLQPWIKQMAPAVFEQYYKLTLTGKKVKFLLDADPVYLIFHAPEANEAWTTESVSVDYVVRATGAGGFKLTNAAYQSMLDDVLKDSKIFDLKSLKSDAKK